MKKRMYAIYDRKSNLFQPPFCTERHEMALRMYRLEAEREESIIKKFPEDFALAFLGIIDDETGKIEQEKIEICEL